MLHRIAQKLLNFNWILVKSRLLTVQFHDVAANYTLMDWQWSIGIAHPSYKYWPAAWTIFTIEKPAGKKPRLEIDRWQVGVELEM